MVNRQYPHPARAIATGILLLAAALALSARSHADLQPLDRIVAVVNEDVVMASELEEQIQLLSNQYLRAQNQLPPRDALLPQVLDKLILDRLQLAIGARAGVQINDAELNQALANTARQQGLTFEQFVARAHEDGLTLAKLRAQFTREMIISRVQRAMVNQRIEITEQEVNNFLKSEAGQFLSSPDVHVGHILLRVADNADAITRAGVVSRAEELRDKLAAGADFGQLALIHSGGPNATKGGDLGWRKAAQLPLLFAESLATISPGEVTKPLHSDAGIHLLMLFDRKGGGEQLIEQNRARHILIKPNEIRSDEQARQLLVELRERIAAGEPFAELARQYSEDTGSALKGGDLDWAVPGQFVAEFENAIQALAPGEISAPLQTQYGWHIIELTDRRKQDFSVEILQNQAINQLRQRRFEEELQVWLDEIRSEAFIEIKS